MSSSQYPYRLMTPGPVPLPKEVLERLARPMIHHRTPEFSKILGAVLDKLKLVFLTNQPVMMLSSTGSGGMEAGLVNVLSPGDKVLSIVSGKFGERWADMAECFGLNVLRLNVAWGQAVSVDEVKCLLEQHNDIRAVLCQACETSTASIHPIQALANLIRPREHTIFIVDAITAIGAMNLPMDEWGLDVVIAGSQKAFMLPTGLSFVALSEKAWKFNSSARCQRFYFDLKAERDMNKKTQTLFSSSVALIQALDWVLGEMTQKGLSQCIARCETLARATREAAAILGLSVYSQSPSNSVTALLCPEDLSSEAVRDRLEAEYNITLMGGQDQLKGKILRIGHLGGISDEDQVETIKLLGKSLLDLKMKGLTQEKVNQAVQITQGILNK